MRRSWTWRTVAPRALEVVREEGWRSLGRKVLADSVLRRLVLVEAEAGPRPRGDDDVEVEWGSVDEYAALRPDVDVTARLERGDRLLVARREGRIVSSAWLAERRARVEYLNRWLDVPPGALYLYDVFTPPEERARGHYGAMLDRFLASERPGRRVLAAVLPGPSTGERALARAGFRPVGAVGYVALGRWRRHFERRA